MFCPYPFTHFEVNNPDGRVTFCCNHALVLGNVRQQTIAEIWNGPAYQEVRGAFLRGEMRRYCPASCPVLQGWKDYEKLDWYRDLPASDPVRQNAELNEREIRAGQTELASQPRWLRFATSYRCNLRCYHCSQGRQERSAAILPAQFHREAEKLLAGLQVLFLYGGEPLIEEANLALLETLADRPGSTRLFLATNGTIMTERIKNILERINLGLLAVSVDSIVPELYEELRPPAKWEALRGNLEYFAGLRRRRGGEFQISPTLNQRNLGEVSAMIDYARRQGAMLLFQYAHNVDQDREFRRRYEIHARTEWRRCAAVLTAARQQLAPGEMPLTAINLEHLAGIAASNSRFWPRLLQSGQRLARRLRRQLRRIPAAAEPRKGQ